MMISSQNENRLAILGLLFSASMWGLIWYPLRLLNDAGMPGIWSALVMYIAAGLLVMPSLLSCYRSDNKALLFSLAIAAGTTNAAFVIALIEGEIMRVMLLFYLSPLWTVILGRLWLKETLSKQAILFFIFAMIGSVIMLWHPELGLPWPQSIADILALIAGIAFATNNVVARKLHAVDMRMKTAATWWGAVLVATVVILTQQLPIPDVSWSTWAGAWLLGWFGMVLMTIAVLYGLARMPVYRSSVIMLFELIVAAIAAWLLTDEVMTQREWIGGVLILLSAYGVARIPVVLSKAK